MSSQVVRLTAGQNVPAPGGVLDVGVRHGLGVSLDVCALLLRADGKVADDSDFVFYNAPTHSSGAVSLTGSSGLGLTINPSGLPPLVERVVVAVSADSGDLPAELAAEVGGGSGPQLVFAPDRLQGIGTAVLVEVYRRAGAWKIRAVGQGWASGLAGLARDYGITVDDEPGDPGAAPSPEASSVPTPTQTAATSVASPTPGRAELEADISRLLQQRAALSAELSSLDEQVRQASSDLVETSERRLLQEVGFYEFRHPLDDAVAYRERLNRLHADMKAAIRDKVAVRTRPGWTVNGSMKEGAALIRDFATLMLRAYNVEADNCVRTVRPSNLAATVKRLDKTRDAILKLGATMGVAIDDGYHEMRMRELRLTADYLAKVEQEKEEARALREQQREDAKAEAELQREEARLLKNRTQWETAAAQLQSSNDAAGAARARDHLADIDGQLQGIRERAANIRTGHVYVISNQGAFGERMVKIGLTRRLEPRDRVYELGNASVPFRFDIHALIFSPDAVGLETALHQEFSAQRVNRVNRRREFFYVTPAQVRDALRKLGENYVLDFKETAEADEWRQSQPDAPTSAAAGRGVRLRHGLTPAAQS